MEPVLRDGDRVTVSRRRRYAPGDIVAFQRAGGELVAHRVLGYCPTRSGWKLMARGDRLSREDEPVTLDRVVGQVVATTAGALDKPGPQLRLLCSFELLRRLARRALSCFSANAS